jgi:hypothetical protein
MAVALKAFEELVARPLFFGVENWWFFVVKGVGVEVFEKKERFRNMGEIS